MKIFAFFLPQFHTIPENDEWWGKGFTEWTNVKAAEPLFKNHKTLHPLNDNYYNLLSISTMKWQTDLLKKYHLDGFIYYHYYFKGKLLLQQPAENLLKSKDIDQPFFFCWANHSWKRTWEGKQDVLMPMEYGNECDWEKHFQYLLPFFCDERYEKKGNKPLFMLFKSNFAEKKAMISYFDKRCKEVGFNGICVIETYTSENIIKFNNELCSETKYVFKRQPDVEIGCYRRKHSDILSRIINKIHRTCLYGGIPVYNGNKLMSHLIDTYDKKEEKTINGLWFEWDNSYRHKERGYIITPYSKQQFIQYMNLTKNEEYIFINAWNEWCEGMVLEPTEEYGYKYLSWINEWRSNI